MSPLSSTPRAKIATSATVVDKRAIRTLVHKHLPENVLLTDIRARSDDRFVCTGRMPVDHSLFNDGGRTPREDVLFYTEVGRQASLAMTHAFLNVSLNDVFIFERSEAALTDAIRRLALRPSLECFVVEINVREAIRRRHDAVCRVVADHLITVGDELVFRGTGTWTIQSAALFRRLRKASVQSAAQGSLRPPRATIADCSRMRNQPKNVVISAPEYRRNHSEAVAALIVDRAHPYFFDHPCDHVPGMLLLEGCAQIALETLAEFDAAPRRATIMAYDMNFMQFVECDLPTTLTARWAHGQRRPAGATFQKVEITISQRGFVCGTASMTIGLSI